MTQSDSNLVRRKKTLADEDQTPSKSSSLTALPTPGNDCDGSYYPDPNSLDLGSSSSSLSDGNQGGLAGVSELSLLLSDQLESISAATFSSASLSDQIAGLSKKVAVNANLAFQGVKRYIDFHELPEHLKDNFYILTGYRANYSVRECLFSVFAIHNETGNIWTHLLGSVFFLFCLYYGLKSIPSNASAMDYLVMTLFLVTAIKCLLCSSIFHTFSAHHHPSIYENVAILDYSGISLLIFGSFVIYLNYSLYCHQTIRFVYIGILCFLCGSGIVLPWFSFFRKTTFRIYRALFFVSMGIAAGIISIHTIFLNGWTHWSDLVPVEYLVLEVVFYLLGAYIYVVRIPEAWFPGRLDLWLHSHQLFHVMVVFAAYSHFIASIHFMESRLHYDTCSR